MLQNRVTPFGQVICDPSRGMFTGNRGIIHDPQTRTLLNRRWTSKAWICCLCDFRGRSRPVMGARSWTELFFLDEATALAAGHRPCFYCRRPAAVAFQDAWADATSIRPTAPAMDQVLHAERLDGRAKRLHPLDRPLAALPDGAMVTNGTTTWLVVGGRCLPWIFKGYGSGEKPVGSLLLLTPPAIISALDAGYRATLHASARDAVY